MKTKILYLLFGLSLLFSCHDDLDVSSKSAINSTNMWTCEEDATSAVYGMYSDFRSAFYYGYGFWGEYRNGYWGDGLASNSTYYNVFENDISADHTYTDWEDIYTTINDANLILKYTLTIEFSDEDTQNECLAHAYFVRAFCYYWIARIWGDAPVVLSGYESDDQDDLYPSRESIETVFDQVVSDIDAALAAMPEDVSYRNMASPGVINMLKADYYLWRAKVSEDGNLPRDEYDSDDLNKAKTALSNVLSNSDYELLSDFSSVFDVDNEENNEIIYEWTYTNNEFTGGYPSDFLVPSQYVSDDYIENPIKVGSHQQWCFYTDEYKEFLSSESNDTRTSVSFETFYDEPKGQTFQWINKFAGTWENETRVFDSDIIVYRYADALLFSAEVENALGNTNEAISKLNEIAGRAYGVDNYYSSLSSSEIDEKILDERMKEFAAEGKTWWDILRFGVAFSRVSSLADRDNEENILLWPVSNESINSNTNITQTSGYE